MRPFKWDIFIDFIIKVLPYLSVTLIYVVGSIFFGFLIGLGIAMLRLSKRKDTGSAMRSAPMVSFIVTGRKEAMVQKLSNICFVSNIRSPSS